MEDDPQSRKWSLAGFLQQWQVSVALLVAVVGLWFTFVDQGRKAFELNREAVQAAQSETVRTLFARDPQNTLMEFRAIYPQHAFCSALSTSPMTYYKPLASNRAVSSTVVEPIMSKGRQRGQPEFHLPDGQVAVALRERDDGKWLETQFVGHNFRKSLAAWPILLAVYTNVTEGPACHCFDGREPPARLHQSRSKRCHPLTVRGLHEVRENQRRLLAARRARLPRRWRRGLTRVSRT
jgi:hypothetical protein